jgi:hypothetical protein
MGGLVSTSTFEPHQCFGAGGARFGNGKFLVEGGIEPRLSEIHVQKFLYADYALQRGS